MFHSSQSQSQSLLLPPTTSTPIHPSSVTPSGFEGPEKKLAVYFSPSVSPSPSPPVGSLDLRLVARQRWVDMLDKVKCTIVSSRSNEHFDAYVLSESSLFVFAQKVVIKTCGTTRLLFAVPELIAIGLSVGLSVEHVWFSRKNYVFPDAQPVVHAKFDDEVRYLNQYFPCGEACVLGPLTQDHWLVYTSSPMANVEVVPYVVQMNKWKNEKQSPIPPPASEEITVEVMMHDLDPSVMAQFFKTYKHETKNVAVTTATPTKIMHSPLPLPIPNAASSVWMMQPTAAVSESRSTSESESEEETSATTIATTLEPSSRFESLSPSSYVPINEDEGSDDSDSNSMRPSFHSLHPVASSTRIDSLLPDGESIIDEHQFDPCGYSMNGLYEPFLHRIAKKKITNGTTNSDDEEESIEMSSSLPLVESGGYWTIHITPEQHFSYVSFETNVRVQDYQALLSRVIDVFRPGSFIVGMYVRTSSLISTAIQDAAGEASDDSSSSSTTSWEKLFKQAAPKSIRSHSAKAFTVVECGDFAVAHCTYRAPNVSPLPLSTRLGASQRTKSPTLESPPPSKIVDQMLLVTPMC